MFSAGLPAKDCQSAENHGNLRLCNIPFNLAIVLGWTRRESGLCGVLNPGHSNIQKYLTRQTF